MNYRSKELSEMLDFDNATPEELVAWNVSPDPTMAGYVAVRAVGSDMVRSILLRADFEAQFEPIP